MNGYREIEMDMPSNYGQPQQIPESMPPQYDRDYDQIQSYGSIIKDLTDTEKFLKAYELRLMGKMEDEEGKEIDDQKIEPVIKSRQTAKDFVDMIRSIANQNTHFTGYKEKDILNTLNSFNYTLCRWMMFQGDKIPLRYRQKLAMEAMNISKASLHKALGALMAKWSKGSISEGQSMNISDGNKSQGILNPMNLFKSRR